MKTSKLYVGNLNYRTTEDTVRGTFAQYGNVVSVRVFEGKGFGFVEMGTVEEAEAAKEALNGTDLEGRNIRVDEARPRQERSYHR
ncbi:MAG: RNA-binding protein [Deltaproteobacteria bacterium]|nr:RNA-binding protein [Deltaproteobacteria bacterium]